MGSKVLKNMEQICAVLGGCGRKMFLRYYREGLPVKWDGRSYTGHADVVEAWWKQRTSRENERSEA